MTLLLIFCIVVIIGMLVTVHEFGHFIAARSLGVAVRQFAIGFGPSLWKKEWKGTEWQINVIPLGGYNAFPDDEEDQATPGDKTYLGNRAVWERAVIIGAGVFMNLVVGFVVFVAMFFALGIPVDEVRLQEVLPGSPAAQAGLKAGDRIASVDGREVHKAAELREYVRARPGQPLRIGYERDGKLQEARLTSAHEIELYNVAPDSPAMRAGLKRGDRILAIGGQPVRTQQEVRAQVQGNAGKPLRLEVEREGKKQELTVTPNDKGMIGVQFAETLLVGDPIFFNVNKARMRPAESLAEPFVYGATYFWRTTMYMGIIMGQLFTGRLPWSDVGGPVMAVHQGVKLAQVSPKNLFFYTAMISIDLAIINILPLPALDGGHLLLLAIEKVRGRRLPRRLEEGILQTGLLVLLGLGILLLFKDVINITGG